MHWLCSNGMESAPTRNHAHAREVRFGKVVELNRALHHRPAPRLLVQREGKRRGFSYFFRLHHTRPMILFSGAGRSNFLFLTSQPVANVSRRKNKNHSQKPRGGREYRYSNKSPKK